MTAHQNGQFNRGSKKPYKLLVHAENLNLGVKGELTKQGVVAALRKKSGVPAHALTTQLYANPNNGK